MSTSDSEGKEYCIIFSYCNE